VALVWKLYVVWTKADGTAVHCCMQARS
jgi:hypothetical protein